MKTAMKSFAAIAAFFATPLVHAHMEMMDPPALESKYNKHAVNVDYSMTSPLIADGSNYPCKGYNKIKAEMTSVATWAAGSSQTVKLTGGAIHDGGSCQLSISEDGGSSFKVIKSFEGNCPASTNAELPVDIPKDAKSGDVLFAWSWNNKVGNREFYMNCAAVTITGGGSGLSSYPDIFVAQLSGVNTCAIAEGVDVKYPNPGKSVVTAPGASLGAPTGNCGSASSGGSSGSSGSGTSTGSNSTTPASSAVPVPSSTGSTGSSGSSDPSGSTGSSDPSGSSGSTGSSGSSDPSGSTGSNSTSPASSGSPVASSPVASAPAAATSAASAPASSGAACQEGKITCNSDGTWSMCGSGMNQNMGKIPGGETCANGAITKRGSGHRFGRRRHVIF